MAAIENLPDDSEVDVILREIAYIAGIEEAREEMARGEGLNSSEAKARLRKLVAE